MTKEPKLPPKPEPPAPGDCCRNDCSPCVFELYDRALEQWEREVAAILAAREPPPQGGGE